MKAILIGAPGCGKGTQARFIHEHFGIPAIATGDMLRAAVREGSALGRRVEAIMAAGELVPDDLMVALVRERIAQPDCAGGFLLDGFPRTIAQAEALADAGIDWVIELAAPDDVIVRRMGGRRVHPASGRVYHVEFNPPRRPDVDDETGEPLARRPDDAEETVRKRLAVYHAQTDPLLRMYRERAAGGPHLVRVDGTLAVAEVSAAILRALADDAAANAAAC